MGILKICEIQPAYLDYLRVHDSKVSEKGSRKFVGIILEVNGQKYCAPLSSPKVRHIRIQDTAPDIVKIDGGKLGVINLNNMIPVLDSAIIHLDILQVADVQYRGLLTQQALSIRSNEQAIMKKAKRLHSMVASQKHPKLNDRCCDFIGLEAVASSFGAVMQPVTQVSQEVAATKEEKKN
ncbi:type III toxin-antitoxin system ToxN/AbiQ family toxin [Paenibacillus puerhi]|uniref:type III toxin-antitoxin system ToxN/AbiQ family toxin n=1 Tax=Paenibacillus puerhi TaxID=2692622 RepID=UPI0013573902|nr:type III toxin-antitoxin system ToxN/AbiQ family toxin [Paenibacillus puerhi]